MSKPHLAALLLMQILLEAVPEDGVPNGHLYAAFIGKLDIDQWNALVNGAVGVNALCQSNFYLTRGPKYESALRGLNTILENLKAEGAQ